MQLLSPGAVQCCSHAGCDYKWDKFEPKLGSSPCVALLGWSGGAEGVWACRVSWPRQGPGRALRQRQAQAEHGKEFRDGCFASLAMLRCVASSLYGRTNGV